MSASVRFGSDADDVTDRPEAVTHIERPRRSKPIFGFRRQSDAKLVPPNWRALTSVSSITTTYDYVELKKGKKEPALSR